MVKTNTFVKKTISRIKTEEISPNSFMKAQTMAQSKQLKQKGSDPIINKWFARPSVSQQKSFKNLSNLVKKFQDNKNNQEIEENKNSDSFQNESESDIEPVENIDQDNISDHSQTKSDSDMNARLELQKEAMGDDFNLAKVFDHEDDPIPYQPGGNQWKFVIMLMYFSLYLIVNSIITLRTSDGYEMSSSIRSKFENLPIDSTSITYSDISDKYYVRLFFYNILLPHIYDETTKEFPAMVEGYHYVNYYNYFAGIRITHNRVMLEDYNRKGFWDRTRKQNYQGRTNQRFSNIHTDQYWLNDTDYSKDGGYAGKGGYIFFLNDNLTYDEAVQFSDDADYNWMFNDEYLTLTFEIMFYNQNLQTG